MINTVENIDCLIGMQSIPNKSIDMILCDLPYGTTHNKWDSIIDLPSLWKQYKRVIKGNGAIVLTAQTPFDKVLGVSNLSWLKYEWIWEKDRPTGHLNSKKMPMKAHENILVFYNSPPTYNYQKTNGHKPMNRNSTKSTHLTTNYGFFEKMDNQGGSTNRFPRSVIDFNVVNSAHGIIHPTQKPVALFEYLIKTYKNEGETVLDNCAGSGTTAIACMNTNRNYILMEKEEKYYQIILDRIKKHTPQLKLIA